MCTATDTRYIYIIRERVELYIVFPIGLRPDVYVRRGFTMIGNTSKIDGRARERAYKLYVAKSRVHACKYTHAENGRVGNRVSLSSNLHKKLLGNDRPRLSRGISWVSCTTQAGSTIRLPSAVAFSTITRNACKTMSADRRGQLGVVKYSNVTRKTINSLLRLFETSESHVLSLIIFHSYG